MGQSKQVFDGRKYMQSSIFYLLLEACTSKQVSSQQKHRL